MNGPEDRHSKAFEAELIADPNELAKREARNALQQFDAVMEMLGHFLDPERPFRLRPSHLLHLHRIALDGISASAGNYRPAGIQIAGSKHEPVGAHLVPEKIEEFCDYINGNWKTASPVHLCAYALWRLNWIHPFTDGNGRTAVPFSYLILCLNLKCRLPGVNTIPDQISRDKQPYYTALESADQALTKGQLDITELEGYIAQLLAGQPVSVHKEAVGQRDLPDLRK